MCKPGKQRGYWTEKQIHSLIVYRALFSIKLSVPLRLFSAFSVLNPKSPQERRTRNQNVLGANIFDA